MSTALGTLPSTAAASKAASSNLSPALELAQPILRVWAGTEAAQHETADVAVENFDDGGFHPTIQLPWQANDKTQDAPLESSRLKHKIK